MGGEQTSSGCEMICHHSLNRIMHFHWTPGRCSMHSQTDYCNEERRKLLPEPSWTCWCVWSPAGEAHCFMRRGIPRGTRERFWTFLGTEWPLVSLSSVQLSLTAHLPPTLQSRWDRLVIIRLGGEIWSLCTHLDNTRALLWPWFKSGSLFWMNPKLNEAFIVKGVDNCCTTDREGAANTA